jgi:hypothetical protein
VEQLAQLAKVSGLSGQVAEASWELEIPRPINLNQIRMQSEYQLVGLNVKGIDIEKAAARISLRDGYLKLDSLEARTGKGLATASMTYDLNDRERLDLVANLNQWTFGTPGGASVRLSADTKLAIDLSRKSALGPIKATADLLLNNAPLGHTEMVAALRGRVLDIKTISGTVSSGNISGMANIDMDRPMEAQGRIQWAGIDAATMGAISPELKGLGGTYSGTITLAPALDPRPLEPLRIDINMSASGGHFRSIKIGDGLVSVHAVAYANTNRAVLDHSEIKIAGGVVHIWARLGRDLVSQIAQVDFENLQLDQIAHVNPAQAGAMPGLLSGQFAVIGSGNDLDELVGNGKIRLTHTDLGNFGPMAALYNAMNHGSGGVNTSGVGLADLTLEQSVLKVTNFRFFNRGIDARGLFSIGPSVWDLHEAQAGGQVTGALRPLKNSRISFLAELDELSSSLQGALTTINISGTVGQPKYNLAAFSQLSGALKELIRGDSPTQ